VRNGFSRQCLPCLADCDIGSVIFVAIRWIERKPFCCFRRKLPFARRQGRPLTVPKHISVAGWKCDGGMAIRSLASVEVADHVSCRDKCASRVYEERSSHVAISDDVSVLPISHQTDDWHDRSCGLTNDAGIYARLIGGRSCRDCRQEENEDPGLTATHLAK
jgi:hypothetical protein